MAKNIENIIKKIMLITTIMIMLTPFSYVSALDSVISDGDVWVQEGEDEGSVLIDQTQLKTEIEDVYNIIFTIGVALSVIIGAVLGIKFMTGSIEEQAKIKEALIPYVIGCIVVFGAFGIWKIMITIGGNIFG